VKLEWFVQSGDPRELIQRHVDAHGGDLIVMGTHGPHGALGWVIGSVAQYVVSHASVPVLVERSAS
jgi:nucleotide-binding universal stress UspA family protein